MSKIDQPLLFITIALVICGIFIVSSASMVISERNYGVTYGYTLRHLFYALILGPLVIYFFQKIPYRFWKKISLPLLIFSLGLLALVFLPKIGFEHGGAKRWLIFPFLTFQPSEIVKFALIVYLASWLDSKITREDSAKKIFIPFVVILGVVSVFMVLEPDIGTLGVIAGTSLLLYFVGGGKLIQIVSLVFLGLFLVYLVIQAAPYRLDRLKVFLNPGADLQGAGYQINQSLISIGSGGVFGAGFGRGIQKYNYLPEAIGDSVFAVIGEELGFLGILVILGLFWAFLWRGVRLAKHAPDFFGSLLAFGITAGIIVQAFINMGASSGLLPLTGIPLPFISYGGTALVMNLAGIGVLLNISKHV